jgi:cyanophycinase
MLVGGGGNHPSVVQRFVALAGGVDATAVLIPTAVDEEDRLTPDSRQRMGASMSRVFGMAHIVVLHTRDRREADTATFAEPLRHASAVWMLGGNEDYLMDTYSGTRMEGEIRALFARGGVVAGTSAGAIVQGSVAVRATSPAFLALVIDHNHTPFALMPNTLILPHWSQRSLQSALATTLASAPTVLGIGIDEGTAAVVQNDRLEVLGDGHVGVYDGRTHDGKSYAELSAGEHYDLKTHRALMAP